MCSVRSIQFKNEACFVLEGRRRRNHILIQVFHKREKCYIRVTTTYNINGGLVEKKPEKNDDDMRMCVMFNT